MRKFILSRTETNGSVISFVAATGLASSGWYWAAGLSFFVGWSVSIYADGLDSEEPPK